MRKDARQNIDANLTRTQRYHEGGSWSDSQAYARMGYENGFNLYTSDRRIPILEDLQTLETGKPVRGYAPEIEMESESIISDDALANVLKFVAFPHFPAHLFKVQHDGSLGYQIGERPNSAGEYGEWNCPPINTGTAEAIAQPATKEGIRNMYKAYKALYNDIMPAFGISCTKSGNCGMHVNISIGCFGATDKTRADAVRKLYYLVNRRYRLFFSLFNRDTSRTEYCRPDRYTDGRSVDLHGAPSDHHCAFNLGHYDAGRVEIRAVGGQENYACFRNTFETIFHLVERVKSIPWDKLDDDVAVFAGCNQYVLSRLKSHGLERGLITRENYDAIAATVNREELL